MGQHQGQSGGRGTEEKCGQELFLWFLWEGLGKAGQAGLGLANLNNFRALWGHEAALCYLGLLGQGKSDLECKIMIEEVVGEYELWIDRFAYMKGTVPHKLFTISRN